MLAVPYNKGCEFCVRRKSTYSQKLHNDLKSDQFQEINGATDEIVIKYKKLINNSQQQLMKQGKISDNIYKRLRSTGSQPGKLYGLAEID